MATYYYVRLVAADEALVRLQLRQQRSVQFLANNHDSQYQLRQPEASAELLYHKVQFQSGNEQVKFHAFQVPGALELDDGSLRETFYEVTIAIDALTPHVYPRLYLKS
jgi:hypothetical protein